MQRMPRPPFPAGVLYPAFVRPAGEARCRGEVKLPGLFRNTFLRSICYRLTHWPTVSAAFESPKFSAKILK